MRFRMLKAFFSTKYSTYFLIFPNYETFRFFLQKNLNLGGKKEEIFKK